MGCGMWDRRNGVDPAGDWRCPRKLLAGRRRPARLTCPGEVELDPRRGASGRPGARSVTVARRRRRCRVAATQAAPATPIAASRAFAGAAATTRSTTRNCWTTASAPAMVACSVFLGSREACHAPATVASRRAGRCRPSAATHPTASRGVPRSVGKGKGI